MPTPRFATAPPPTPHRTRPDHAERVASPAWSAPSPTAPLRSLRAHRVGEPPPFGSYLPDRRGRGRHDTLQAGGSALRPARVADPARTLVPLRLVRASSLPAFPSSSSWRLSPWPSTPSGVPPHTASWLLSLAA